MEIYQKAFDIIERYFGTEEEDKDVSNNIVFQRSSKITISPLQGCSHRDRESVCLWSGRGQPAASAGLQFLKITRSKVVTHVAMAS